MKITDEIIEHAKDLIMQQRSMDAVKHYLYTELKLSGTQGANVIKKAKELIRQLCNDISDVQRELNILFLNETVADTQARREDRLKATDLINKMLGEYTTKVELANKDVKFVLGTMSDEWTNQLSEQTDEEISEFIDGK